MAFYLKYRPQNLSELVGQEQVKKILSTSFASGNLSHAYLFTGPRGTGKTSTARILAKMVNCELVNRKSLIVNREDKKENDNRYTIDDIPCNKCQTCLSITDGSNLDLIEIDAASNRGIDDIRALREKIKLSPTASKKKIYIIDEVHMLTTEAFNALLKTLEEPPAHALFILATTDVNKIPQTILSRVQRLDFKLASLDELLESFKKIVEQEKIEIDDAALKILAKKAEGSFRDGIKLLDQASSLNKKITTEDLEKLLKSGKTDELFLILENLAKKDAKNSLNELNKIIQNGVDIKIFILGLMDTLRNMVYIKNNLGDGLVKDQYSEEDYLKICSLTESFTTSDLVNVLNLLQESFEKLKFTSIPSLPLELVIAEFCGSVDQRISESPSKEDQSLVEVNQRKVEIAELQINQPADIPISSDSSDMIKLKEKWTYVCETVRPYNFSLEALLRSIKIADCTTETVLLEVPYSFHQRILESPKNREILESILSDILGRQIIIATVLGIRPERKEDIANIEIAQDDEIIRAAAEIFSSDIN